MDVRRLLKEFDIQPRKSLGQNFLADQRALERIVEAAELGPGDIVLEIGPGLGILILAMGRMTSSCGINGLMPISWPHRRPRIGSVGYCPAGPGNADEARKLLRLVLSLSK